MIDFKKINKEHNGTSLNYRIKMENKKEKDRKAEVKKLQEYIINQELYFLQYQKIAESEIKAQKKKIDNLVFELMNEKEGL